MSLITKNTHALISYCIGLILTFSPWLFGFDAGGPATVIPWLTGLGIILFTLLSDHEYGSQGGLSLRIQCLIESFLGLLLGFSPWIFGFSDYASLTHLISGLSLSLTAIISAPLNIQRFLLKIHAMKEVAVEKNKQAIITATNVVLNKHSKQFN